MPLTGVGVALLWTGAAAIGAGASGGAHVTVKPAIGSPRTHFVVSFTAGQTGLVGSESRRYEVVATGPKHSGCSWNTAVRVAPTHQGQRVHVTLAAEGSAAWCAGEYKGQVDEDIAPVCPAGKLCPLIIEVRTAGRFSFRVM
jgi:hypothetical protein